MYAQYSTLARDGVYISFHGKVSAKNAFIAFRERLSAFSLYAAAGAVASSRASSSSFIPCDLRPAASLPPPESRRHV